MLDTILITILSAALNGLFLSIAFYIGYTKGTRKAIKIIIEEIGEILKEKPEIQAIITLLTQKSDPPELKQPILLKEES